MLLKELQSLCLDVRVLRDDNTEVEIGENIDYSDSDLRSIIVGDRSYNQEESFGDYGYQQQEFDEDSGELVSADEEEEELEDDFDEEFDEALDADSFDE